MQGSLVFLVCLMHSPFMNPLKTEGLSVLFLCRYWKLFVGFIYDLISSMLFSWNLTPLYIVVSRKLTLFSEISYVKLVWEIWWDYCIQGIIHPRFIFAPLPLSATQIQCLKLSRFKHNYFWSNSRLDETICKCRRAQITQGQNNPYIEIHS